MDTYDFEDGIRSLINAWENGKLNWQYVEVAAHLLKKEWRKSSFAVGQQKRPNHTGYHVYYIL